MKLSKTQWQILNSLADGSEPIEQIFLDLQYENLVTDPNELLPDICALFDIGHITISQIPLGESVDQRFDRLDIKPANETDVLGDLREQYARFREKKDYLNRFAGGGVPMGIYLEMTANGRSEWDRDEYRKFWDEC